VFYPQSHNRTLEKKKKEHGLFQNLRRASSPQEGHPLGGEGAFHGRGQRKRRHLPQEEAESVKEGEGVPISKKRRRPEKRGDHERGGVKSLVAGGGGPRTFPGGGEDTWKKRGISVRGNSALGEGEGCLRQEIPPGSDFRKGGERLKRSMYGTFVEVHPFRKENPLEKGGGVGRGGVRWGSPG